MCLALCLTVFKRRASPASKAGRGTESSDLSANVVSSSVGNGDQRPNCPTTSIAWVAIVETLDLGKVLVGGLGIALGGTVHST